MEKLDKCPMCINFDGDICVLSKLNIPKYVTCVPPYWDSFEQNEEKRDIFNRPGVCNCDLFHAVHRPTCPAAKNDSYGILKTVFGGIKK